MKGLLMYIHIYSARSGWTMGAFAGKFKGGHTGVWRLVAKEGDRSLGSGGPFYYIKIDYNHG